MLCPKFLQYPQITPMTIPLDLPPELEAELAKEAAQIKLPLSEYIMHLLSVRQVFNHPPKSGRELIAYWQAVGVIGSRPDITNPQKYASQLRSQAEFL
jgi:hypothetical protein